jgi:4-amino-4-deoxy-L-arabinose transferase-like glycosyltransferase
MFLAFAVTAVCLFDGLGRLGLVGPDDPRYAFIARAMLQSGDWVTPRLYGQPWFEKPILYYWAAAAAFRLFGVTEFAARLPSALGALLATLAMAWAALRTYGRSAATLIMLLLPTTIAAIAFARAATPDMLFAGLLTAAATAAAAILEQPGASRAAQIIFGASLGAATLAKGPAAIILAAGATFLWALAARQWRTTLRLLDPVALATFFVVALPWYVLCAARNAEFFRVFILEHNFARYLTPVFQHPQPFWFFGVVILAATVPWTVLLIPLAISARRSFAMGSWKDSPALFFACWAVFPVVFFSFSESKLPGYILPSVPPLIFLFSVDAQRYLAGPAGNAVKAARWWIAANAGLLLVLAPAAGIWLRQLPVESGLGNPLAMRGLLAFTLACGALCICLALAGRPRYALLCEAVLMTAILLGVNTSVLPRLDPYLSARVAVREMPPESRVALDALDGPSLAVFELDRPWHYAFNFYLERELPEWTPGREKTAQPGWIWTSAAGAAHLDRLGVKYSVVKRVTSEVWLVRAEQ